MAQFGGAMSIARVCFSMLLITSYSSAARWSRQLTGEANEGEWIPLQSDGKPQQQAQARVLVDPRFTNSFFPPQESFHDYLAQGGARQLFVQSPNSVAQQSFAPKSQAQPIRLTLTGQFNAIPQSFSFPRTNSLPYNEFRQSIQAQFQQQPNLAVPPVQFNNQFFNQPQKGIALAPINQQPPPLPKLPSVVKQEFIPFPNTSIAQDKPVLPTLKERINEDYSSAPIMQDKISVAPTTPLPTTLEKEEVQLLYVPLETLQNKMFDVKQFLKNPKQSLRDSIGSPGQINNQLYPPTTPVYSKQTQFNNIQKDLYQQQVNSQIFQDVFSKDQKFVHPSSVVTPSPFSYSTRPIPVLSTSKPKKLKAHQPPLAIYMLQNGKDKARLGDVLSILKESSSISVLDNIPPNAPKVFVGPNNLKTPSNIIKFELPYLSNIDGSRIPRRIESLPFFVAPLSYKAPNGFAKIPFPAPHIGSVIVNPYMKDAEESSTILSNQNSVNTFPQSITEGFKTTLKETIPTKPTFNYFPSTNNPQDFSSAFPNLKQSSVTFPNQFSTIYSTKNPEVSIINTSKVPPSTFYPTSPRPSVTFYGFSDPTFTQPTTTHKPSTPSLNDNRGHYITNAAVETPRQPSKQSTPYKEIISERPNTSPIPQHIISKSPYNFLSPFVLRNPYEPDYIQNVRGNDVRHYNVGERPEVQNVNRFPQNQQFSQFPQFQNRPEPQVVNFPPKPSVSSSPFPVEHSPTAGPTFQPTPPSIVNHELQQNIFESNRNNQPQYEIVRQPDTYVNKDVVGGFVPLYDNQYVNPSTEPEVTEVAEIETETTPEDTTTTSTTTTTTTTPAPTTRFTRRPISRGRPRYTTTPKPEGDDTTIRPTTRRTPLRERRPSTYRSRITTTTESTEDGETTTKRPFSRTRFTSRTKSEGDETTTERNVRFRSRGKSQYKANNYEGGEYVAKKKKEEEGDLAYQRDVLHQNYPVTLAEKLTTLEVRTTPSTPSISSTTVNGNNIRIYETTGSTQRPISSTHEAVNHQEYYENEAVFQREPEKYLTHPDEYVEINGKSAGRTTPIQRYKTEEIYERQTTPTVPTTRYEEPLDHTITEEYYENMNIEKINQHRKIVEEEKIETHGDGGLTYKYAPDVILTESPVPKFRTKLKNRPKLLQSLSTRKPIEDEESSNPSTNAFITSTKKAEVTTTENYDYARKSSPTHRPLFNNRRTTMKIEEIEEELKARRTQLNSRSTTHKYPVYVAESSSTTPTPTVEENDVITRRTKITRRRPIKATTQNPNESSNPTSSSERPPNVKVRRVRVRTKVRKTTTESPENEAVNEEKYATTQSPRLPVQRYSTKNRQRYFKRPVNLADKNEQNDNIDDQAYFDSINRPEIIRFNPETGTHEYVQYNLENGKAETQWSPKSNPNAFRPIFNPNLISGGYKNDDYGKLSFSEINLNEPEIITAGNTENDYLITVTPPTNKLNNREKETRQRKEYIAEKPSTFETVLEEVMRNLEEQDGPQFMTVVKHEGGEIGEIPPESTIQTNIEVTEPVDIKPTLPPLPTTMAEERYFSAVPDVQATSTERKGRRRGGWRKVKVRPVQKDVMDEAESQYYKNTKNELTNDQKTQIKYENFDKEIKEQKVESTTIKEIEHPTTLPYAPPTKAVNQYQDQEQTEYPDLIAMEILKDDVTYPAKKEKDSQQIDYEINTEYLMSRTDQPVDNGVEEEKIETITEQINTVTTVQDVHKNETETITLKEEVTSTEQPTEEVIEDKTEGTEESFLDVMERLLGSGEEQQITKTVEPEVSDNKEEKEKVVENKENLETSTSGFKFFDPNSVISTSVSTQISHETEICFRGKCIKTNKLDSKK